jgi:hypothetical protein
MSNVLTPTLTLT